MENVERRFERFKDAPWFDKAEETVLVGGAGGIASWLTFFLNRAGLYPMVYDFDTVDELNLGGQLFRKTDIGTPKVQALYNIVKEFCGEELSVFNMKIEEGFTAHYITLCGFDNMEARRTLFNSWKRTITNCPVTPIFIDGRLEAESLQIFCVTPENMDEYERDHLFDDSLLEDASCSFRQTSHTAAMIASHMTAFLTNHLTNIYERAVIREVPFFYEYFIPMNLTETR